MSFIQSKEARLISRRPMNIQQATAERCEVEHTLQIIAEFRKEIEIHLIEIQCTKGVHKRQDKLQTLQKLRKTLFYYEQRAGKVGAEAIQSALVQMRDFINNLLK